MRTWRDFQSPKYFSNSTYTEISAKSRLHTAAHEVFLSFSYLIKTVKYSSDCLAEADFRILIKWNG